MTKITNPDKIPFQPLVIHLRMGTMTQRHDEFLAALNTAGIRVSPVLRSLFRKYRFVETPKKPFEARFCLRVVKGDGIGLVPGGNKIMNFLGSGIEEGLMFCLPEAGIQLALQTEWIPSDVDRVYIGMNPQRVMLNYDSIIMLERYNRGWRLHEVSVHAKHAFTPGELVMFMLPGYCHAKYSD